MLTFALSLQVEQDIYRKEGVQIDRIDFIDNQQCLDLLESHKPPGILRLLDEEDRMSRASDEHLLTRMLESFGKDFVKNKTIKISDLRRRESSPLRSLSHLLDMSAPPPTRQRPVTMSAPGNTPSPARSRSPTDFVKFTSGTTLRTPSRTKVSFGSPQNPSDTQGYNPCFRRMLKKADAFMVRHYAGDVEYCVSGFLHKNRDRLHQSIADLICTSNNDLLAELFSDESFTTEVKSEPVSMDAAALKSAERYATVRRSSKKRSSVHDLKVCVCLEVLCEG